MVTRVLLALPVPGVTFKVFNDDPEAVIVVPFKDNDDKFTLLGLLNANALLDNEGVLVNCTFFFV